MDNNIDREVGEIKTQVHFLTQDVSEIKSDVKTLLAFKWRLAGNLTIISAMAAFLATLLIEIARAR